MKDELTPIKIALIIMGACAFSAIDFLSKLFPKKKEVKLEHVLLANAFLHDDREKIRW